MAIIEFVRHGEAAASFAGHVDPGLSELGKQQAHETASKLATGARKVLYTSPLRRARETADALYAIWNVEPIVEPRVAEIPSPTSDLEERANWLATTMRGRWPDLPPSLQTWRQAMIDFVVALPHDAIVFSHLVAINILVGAATGQDRLISFRPDNASITSFDNVDGTLKLVSRGTEANSRVN